MNAEATILKAKSIYVEMAEVEKEKAMHDERSKDCKKRIEGFQAQVKELVNAVDGPQGDLHLDSPALGIFACVEGEMHDWQRIRDDEDRSLETCEICGGERVYEKRIPDGEAPPSRRADGRTAEEMLDGLSGHISFSAGITFAGLLAAHRAEVSELERMRDGWHATFESHKAQRDELAREVEAYKSESASHREALAKLAAIRDELQRRIDAAKADLQDWRANVSRNHPSVTESPIYHERVDRVLRILEGGEK